jgi:hypothetical protein
METCTVETGLLKKKPCGSNGVTHCANCEQPLCRQHAVAQKTAGKFMCKECDAARKEFEKNPPPAPAVKKPAEAPKPAPAATAANAAATPAKPGAPKEAPAAATVDHGDALEFTPSKK